MEVVGIFSEWNQKTHVSTLCQPDRAEMPRQLAKNSGVFVRVFPKRLAIDSINWVKKIGPHQCGWASPDPLTAWIGPKEEDKGVPLFLSWAWTSISCFQTLELLDVWPLGSGTYTSGPANRPWLWIRADTMGSPGSQASLTWLELHLQLTWFSSLQTAGSWAILAFHNCTSCPMTNFLTYVLVRRHGYIHLIDMKTEFLKV